MKKLIAILIINAAFLVSLAAVSINITIPDAYVARVVPALTAAQDSHVHVKIRGSQASFNPIDSDYALDFDFRTDRDPNETTAQYAKSIYRRMTLAWAIAHEEKVNGEERQKVIDALPPTDSNLPDEAVQ